MKIYLIAPRNPESFWTFDRILPSLKKKCLFPNLSLPTVAGITPREHEVVLCDENVEEIDFDTDADIVGLTGYVVHEKRILELAREFKRRGKFVVAGGPLASLCPEKLTDKVDVVFVDEAEYTWPQFLSEYPAGEWKAEYRQHEKPSMHDSPLPRFDLLQIDQYRTMTIQFARGCPFNCEFCDIIVMYGRKPRTKTVEQVMAEVAEIHRLGVQNIFVVDDNFIGNKPLAKQLLHALADWQKARGYPIEFLTEVTLNVAQDDELLRLMRQANFATIFIGIESPRKESLQETHKTQNLREDILESVHRIQRAGIDVMAGMIPLHPGRAHSDLDDRNVERGAQDPAPPAAEGGGPADRRVRRRPVRLHQYRPEGDVAGAALRGIQEAAGAPLQLQQLPAAGHAASPPEGEPDPEPDRGGPAGPRDPSADPLDLHPAGLAAARVDDPLADGRDGPAPPEGIPPGRDAGPDAQAPLRVHARHLQAPGRDDLGAPPGPRGGPAGNLLTGKINLEQKLSLFDEHWQPKIVGELNGQHVKLVKFQGPFVWHKHEGEDEMFLVLGGEFDMEFRDKTVRLREGEFLIVPKGVEHRPVAEKEARVLLFEPVSTVNTGDAGGPRTVASPERI
jgi:mannose-6-phosphate isomerase-like protein (cupin superfamily)/DNA repair photolyase